MLIQKSKQAWLTFKTKFVPLELINQPEPSLSAANCNSHFQATSEKENRFGSKETEHLVLNTLSKSLKVCLDCRFCVYSSFDRYKLCKRGDMTVRFL